MEPSRYALALYEARRALDQQASDLSHIRDRMTNIVAVGGLTAAFIGGLAIRDRAPLSGWTWLGAGAFTALVAVAVWVHLPRPFVFTQKADDLVRWAKTAGMTNERMERNLAIHMRRHYVVNRGHLVKMTVLFVIGLALLLLEVVALLLDLRGR